MDLPATIEDRQQQLDQLHRVLFSTAQAPPTPSVDVEDDAVISRAASGAGGAVFARLWAGDSTGYASQSEADLALCSRLAYVTGYDAAQVDRLFRRSGLYRQKWDQTHFADGRTYGQATIAKALEGHTDQPEPFPLTSLPPLCRTLVDAGATAMVVPPDFLAVSLLVSAGAVLGNGLVLEVKPGWQEGSNLYGGIVASPGAKKSPAFGLALEPIYLVQQMLTNHFDQAWHTYIEALQAWEAAPNKRRGKKPEPPTFQHVITTDATTEALATMQVDSGGILLFRDELTGWAKSLDQYRGGKGADRQHFLSMWSRSPIKVDRKGSPRPIIVPKPHLSVLGGIQPDMLTELADRAQREDGFLDRLLWSCPEPRADRWTSDAVPSELVNPIVMQFGGLYSIRLAAEASGITTPRIVRLGADAAVAWESWYNAHAAEVRSRHFSPRLAGPWAKMPGQLARLTLILHALHDPSSSEVSRETMSAAIDLVSYFKSHARRVYRVMTQQRTGITVKILQALKEHGEIPQAELSRGVFQRNVSAARLHMALEELESAGLIVKETKGTGGRPATVWRLA